MKSYLLSLSFLFSLSLCAQIQVGNYDNTFYHVEYSPSYKIEDSVSSNLDNITHSVLFDLDNDNSMDLNITSISRFNLGSGGYYPFWESKITVINDSLDIISLPNANTTPNTTNPDTLILNDFITANNSWVSLNAEYFRLARNINNFTIDSTWKNQTGHFIGFRIRKPNQDTLLGWIQLDVQDYHIIRVSEHACQSYSPNDTIIDPNIVGIKQVYNNDILTIYPNPVHNKLNIIHHKIGETIKRVELYSINGKLLMSKEEISGKYNLNTSELKNGVFILRVYLDNDSIINSKVVK